MPFQNSNTRKTIPKGIETQMRILAAAALLFAKNGFEMTSLAEISKSSSAPIGSITHHFGDKAALAKAIYATAVGRLVTPITRAVDQHPTDIERTVNKIIAGCVTWAERYPHDRQLIQTLSEYARPNELTRTHTQIEPVLMAWAQPLISAGLLLPLTGPQLYAVMIAPVLYAVAADMGMPDSVSPPEVAWTTILSNAALAAILPPRQKLPTAKVIPRFAENSTAKVTSRAPPDQGLLI